MDMLHRLTAFSTLDGMAVGLLMLSYLVIGWRIEHPSAKEPSVSRIMANYRREWMRTMVSRQPRILDGAILNTLRQGITFFASTCLIAIGGGLALIGNAERLMGVAEDLTLSNTPIVIYELKIIVVILFLTNALLKFIWSHRLFGYCAVLMAAVPNDPQDPTAMHRAEQAATININAARAFNRGLRAIYFALGSLAWLLGAPALILATGVTCWVLWRREFRSTSRDALLRKEK
ncbi:DUF599 domain-containing protein [Aliiroseovarius sp. PTFE2010]|uniref:DUF599 domain-containing protein n=1 Tax=Aliiroseovarius sp. PTFE2010 TaxID=3417190 RepID=UPI003CFB0224